MNGSLLRLPQTIGVLMPRPSRLGAQGRDERPVLVVDRAAATEVVVVLADGLETFVRDAPAGGDAPQERHDLVGALGTAEAEQDHGVVRFERRGLGLVGRRCCV